MLATNRFAFKEWAVVCAALAAGRQALILRKGGIHEGQEGFRVEHPEFWLFPTAYHQKPEEILADARPLLNEVQIDRPPEGTIAVSLYAVVEEVFHVRSESHLPGLSGLTVLSDRTVSQRFGYRRPGLFALALRAFTLPEPLSLPDSPHFAGCRSWVDFPIALSTEGLQPVLSHDEAECRLKLIRDRLTFLSNG